MKIKLVALLVMWALGNCNAQTRYPYWPMTPGSSITYQVWAIHAFWSSQTWQLWITSVDGSNGQQTITCFPTSDNPAGIANLYQEVTTLSSQPSLTAPSDLSMSIVEGEFAPTGVWYLGEYTGYGQTLCVPGEAKLTLNPQSGECIDVHSRAVTKGAIQPYDIHWIYRTIGHGSWSSWPDCWWTSLVEYDQNGNPVSVYNYVFARGIGMVSFWFVQGLNGNVGQGYLFTAISRQGQ
jgi:hypothetical protein